MFIKDCFCFRVRYDSVQDYYRVRKVLNDYQEFSLISDVDDSGYLNIAVFDVFRRTITDICYECKGNGIKVLDTLTVNYLLKVLSIKFNNYIKVFTNFSDQHFIDYIENERR